MQTIDIIDEIKRLPIQKRYLVLEEIIKSIKNEEGYKQMEFAANELQEEYKKNTELTEFVSLDFEDFYETR
ncbi:MAG: hypothetical protein Q8R57_09425 [Bacteroidota bacterium]|jgi:hypothetical protein|nr:hypothetical protein [Bacteroidota bacterium]